MSAQPSTRAPHPGEPGPHSHFLKKLQEHLKANLVWYVSASIAMGWLLGYLNQGFAKQHQAGFKTLITIAVFFMIYPMMVNIRFDALARATRNLKGVRPTTLIAPIRRPIGSRRSLVPGYECYRSMLGFHTFHTLPTRSGPGFSVGSPGIQPAGAASAPPDARTIW